MSFLQTDIIKLGGIMEFTREIGSTIQYKLDHYEKPLMILGARQIGKTTLVKTIGQNHSDYVYINLEQQQTISNLFNGDLVISKLIFQIEVLLDITISNSTLLIFDEIQFNPQAITSLKYFAENNTYKVLATGSNLGITLLESNSSFPVGKVELINMYQLSFLEFLNASKKYKLYDFLKQITPPYNIPDSIHNLLFEQFDIYIELGGYPEVVSVYLQDGYRPAINKSRQLLQAYKNDISKYVDPKLTSRLQHIYEEVSTMLQQDNQKFRFTQIDAKGYKNLEYPMHWLINSGMIQIVHRVESSTIPLASHIKNNSFKVLLNDTGLLLRQADYSSLELMDSRQKIYLGLVVETYIGNIINKYKKPLFYYHRNTTEVDYLLQLGGKVIPIDVKSGLNTKAKSLQTYNQRHQPELMIKISRMNYHTNNNLVSIPIYLFETYLINLLTNFQEQYDI